MATSGRRIGRAAVALGALVALASACSGATTHQPSKTSTSSGPHQTPTTATTPPAHLVTCTVHPPASVTSALAAGGPARNLALTPFTSSVPGAVDVAAVYSSSFSGVALVDVTTGEVLKDLQSFDDPQTQQAAGSYNGTYAVWKVYYSLESLNDFTVWLWNSRSGSVTQVGAARRAPNGDAYDSPWFDPVVSDDYAAWIEGTDNRGVGEVHLLRLASRQGWIVATSHATSVFLSGDKVLWAQSDAPGRLTRIHAADVATRRGVAPPPSLTSERGGWGFTPDGTAVSWVGSDSASLWSASSQTSTPHKMVQLHSGGFNPPLFFGDGIVAAASSDGVVVASALQGWHFVMPDVFSVSVSGSVLELQPPSSVKTAHLTTPWVGVGLDSLKSLSC